MRRLSPKLSPWLEDVHKNLATMVADGFKPTAISAREGLTETIRAMVLDKPVIAWVNDELVTGREYSVPVRIYHPAPDEARPVLIFYHGGGGTAGSVWAYDPIARKIAAATGHIVVSVEYRLAPENPYPAGVTDAYAVVCGVWDALERRSLKYQRTLSVSGDSAGGALACMVSSLAQFHPEVTIANQILIYPCLDYTLRLASIEENAENYFLTKDRITWYMDYYFQHGENRFEASPLYQKYTSALPRTLMITAEFDPLRDDGYEYLKQLDQVGVEYEHLHLHDLVHAYLFMDKLIEEECTHTYESMARFLNHEKLTKPPGALQATAVE